MSKKLKWIGFSLIAVVLAVVAFKATANSEDDGIKVTVETVKRRTIVETVSASGKIYPETEIRITPPIAGEITELNVREGDKVEKGQVLARIQGDRVSSSPQRVSVPPGFESLVQGMQQPRTSSPSSAVIKAPLSGTVLGLNVKKGERVNLMQMPSGDMMRIADLSTIEVRVDVNENNIIKVNIGDSADVEVEAYNKRKFKGVVTAITNGSSKREAQSFLSADLANFEVRIRLLPETYSDLYDSTKKNIPFRPGMNARAEIKTKRRENVQSVPVGAVVSRPKGSEQSVEDAKKEKTEAAEETNEVTFSDELEEVVFVVKQDGTVERRVVTTGIQDINYFEITSGLKEGEQVVTGPYNAVSKTLQSGKKITVVTKDKLFENK